MFAESGDPTTNFTLDGYLIGARINTNRAILTQCLPGIIGVEGLEGEAGRLPGSLRMLWTAAWRGESEIRPSP